MPSQPPECAITSSRREFIQSSIALGSTLISATAANAQATQAGGSRTSPADAIITRTIPGTSEAVPVIGLGTFVTFDMPPGHKRDHLRECMRRFWDAGGRVIDTSPLYGMAEVNVGHLANALGIADQMFIANKIWATGDSLSDESHIRRSFEVSRQRLWRERIDAMQCHSLVNVDKVVPLLRAWKKEGRIRYVGVTHHEVAYFPALANWVERGDLDFVQIHYSIVTREAEQRILPAAADRGTAVLVNMPFEKARLFKLVQGRPLPDFASEIGAQSWGQFFLKWVISHPAVTCVLPATANPDHVTDNVGALRGGLPDRKMRERMLKHMESIPGFNQLVQMAPYPEKIYPKT
jgi:diketogulonate reductase-like aldo/keto reductase